MSRKERLGFTLLDLLVLLVLLGLLLGLLLPAVAKLREVAARAQSVQHLQLLGQAGRNYHDAMGTMAPGVDARGFSTAVHLLPYLEENTVYQRIDLKKAVDDPANALARAARLKVFLSPMDEVAAVRADVGATNYLFSAGSKADLAGNDGVFYQGARTRLTEITDGISNTLMAGETLKGAAPLKGLDVRRQHVLLPRDALKGLKEQAGVADFENNRNIATDRCASWIDGRFLQSTFTGTRILNDPRPDVNCGGQGGLSGLRSGNSLANLLMCDGSVRPVNNSVKQMVWKSIVTRNGGEVIGGEDY